MLAKRIIPCLDVKDGRVVKGVNFLELRDAGDPVEQAQVYDREGADELVFLDITASHERRDIVIDMVRRVADSVFIPFTVGGGIRDVASAAEVSANASLLTPGPASSVPVTRRSWNAMPAAAKKTATLSTGKRTARARSAGVGTSRSPKSAAR